MASTAVRTNLALHGGLRLNEAAKFPKGAKGGATCLLDGVLYVRAEVGGVNAWLPLNGRQQHHVHTQGAAARVWEVNHGFTGSVSVMAYGADGNAMPATVVSSGGMASVDVGGNLTGYAVAFGLSFDPAGTASDLVGEHAASGDHDGRYYTRGQIDAALGKKLDGASAYTDANAVAAVKASSAWNAAQWDEAYGWGNHAMAGYLTRVSWGGIDQKPDAYPPESHNHDGHHALEAELKSALGLLAGALNEGATTVGAVTIR